MCRSCKFIAMKENLVRLGVYANVAAIPAPSLTW